MGTHPIFESDFDCLTECRQHRKKHANFVSEPMGEKEVTEIAGIGETYGQKLKDQGFEKAFNLLGQFLLLNKDEEMFKEWLKEEVGVKGKHLNDCTNCISEWTRSYV